MFPQECMDNKKWQDEVLSAAGKYSIAFLAQVILASGIYYSATRQDGGWAKDGLGWAANHIANTGEKVFGGIRGYLPV
jgi:hypothetical protein